VIPPPNPVTGYHIAPHQRTERAGFTLLEIIAVLAIMALVIGLAVFNFDSLGRDKVEDAGDALIVMAKQTLDAATVLGHQMNIQFDETGFAVLGGQGVLAGRYTIPDGLKMEILRFQAKDWVPADGNIWSFSGQGLCEPIRVRLESPTASREINFNALTGTPIGNE